MSLKHAVLAALLDGEASGYELAKRMNVSVANFWHALPTQIYAELRRLEAEGLVGGVDVEQAGRPDKRVYRVSRAGYEELGRFAEKDPRPTAIKDELLIQIQSADFSKPEEVAAAIDERREQSERRLALYERLIERLLEGGSEEEYLARAERIGPYLNLRRGRDFDRENIAWYRWAAQTLRERARRPRPRRRTTSRKSGSGLE
jgi:DNA-binding PadR family transcriptional regulator